MDTITYDEILDIYHHVFLPPKLPHSAEEKDELYLTRMTSHVLSRWSQFNDTPLPVMSQVSKMIERMMVINGVKKDLVDETRLRRLLGDVEEAQTLAINIKAQNAAVLITGRDTDVIFEAFELSARNEDVITTQGRLTRTFPDRPIAVDRSQLQDGDLISEMARTLATMCQQAAPGMQPQTSKGGSNHDEIRDTPQPLVVSELFVAFLRSIGSPVAFTAVEKHTRDEVNWNNTLRPWRRSPTWLLIRVAIQLVLERAEGGSRRLYKSFMLFLMACVLERAHSAGVATEVLFCMTAKITRRVIKMTHPNAAPNKHDPVIAHAVKILESVNETISTRWTEVQDRDRRKLDLSALATLDAATDCQVDLTLLDEYISTIQSRQRDNVEIQFRPDNQLSLFSPHEPPNLDFSSANRTNYMIANLREFEQWVSQHLEQWESSTTDVQLCETVQRLMEQYYQLGSVHYDGNPEAKSIMILTIFELWVACDKAAVRSYLLLREYDPEIHSDVLQNLLLPFAEQMERLAAVEAYLSRRKEHSHNSAQLLFETGSYASFPCRFFRSSPEHQALKTEIEAEATRARNAKLQELRNVKAEYSRLDDLCSRTSCEYREFVTGTWYGRNETEIRHVPSCQRCKYEQQRDALSIEIFEEPLPFLHAEAEAVVFELCVPALLAHWRDTRCYLLQNVLKGTFPAQGLNWRCLLSQQDPHLTFRFYRSSATRRVDLLSENKPTTVTHYRSKEIVSASALTVCVRNALHYRYFDTSAGAYLGKHSFGDQMALECTYQPSRPVLRRYLIRTSTTPDGQPPNNIIADQHACPQDMTREEFKALAIIPCGRRIQWMNIAKELVMPAVDFQKPDTALFFLQCIYQAGPPGKHILRESHAMLADDGFAASIVRGLATALSRIRENWGLVHALGMLVAVAARVLSLSQATDEAALNFLQDARHVAAEWNVMLRDKAHDAISDGDRTGFVSKSVESALICLATFDVDQDHLSTLLDSPTNVSLIVRMMIVVQEGQRSLDPKNTFATLYGVRISRLMHRCYHILSTNQIGISRGIQESWAGFPPGEHSWTQASDDHPEWITTGVAAKNAVVHYNLLTGELLVNGEPLDQPHETYREQALFKTLFKRYQVEVMPSAEPGFKYSTKRTFAGFDLMLGLNSTGELIVRARKEEVIWESVPSRVLDKEYPTHFSRDYVHWYNIGSGEVVFMDRDHPWPSRTGPFWILSRCGSLKAWTMSKEDALLVGYKSMTARTIGDLIKPLAPGNLIHISMDKISSTLQLELPVARLRFFLGRGETALFSQDYPGMSLASDQSVGSLIGLYNKLVLQSDKDRMVLIPESTVKFCRNLEHVTVEVSTARMDKMQALTIDPLLGRLVSRDDLGSKLYLAYLHALTSFCLPDPLLQCTGTEQSLTILQSKSLPSFTHFTQENVSLLEKIAHLSPGRAYYPNHLRCMQVTSWNKELSIISQDDNLVEVVDLLLHRIERQTPLSSPGLQLKFPRSEKRSAKALRLRARIRASMLRVSGYGAEDFTTKHDKQYEQRGNKWSDRATNALVISKMLLRPGYERHWGASSVGTLYNVLREESPDVHGASATFDEGIVRYNGSNLESIGFKAILAKLPAFHRWTKHPTQFTDRKFAVVIWFASLAFAEEADMTTLQLLALTVKQPKDLRDIAPPRAQTYDLQEGKEYNPRVIAEIEEGNRHSYESCPEFKLERGPSEDKKDFNSRRRQAWQRAKKKSSEEFRTGIQAQWPCQSPTTPDLSDGSTYIDLSRAMNAVRKYFQKWYDCRRLSHYLEKIETVVQGLKRDQVVAEVLPKGTVLSAKSWPGYVSQADLFRTNPPSLSEIPSSFDYWQFCTKQSQQRTYRLGNVISTMKELGVESAHERRWIEELESSWQALQALDDAPCLQQGFDLNFVRDNLNEHQRHASVTLNRLRNVITLDHPRRAIQVTAHWPRVRPVFLLQQLSRRFWPNLPMPWKEAVVTYAKILSDLQRAERMVKCMNEPDAFLAELQNRGRQVWDPLQQPEWLLMEVESGIMIRSVQQEIASQMLLPDANRNSAMQLNMGEGKSTVIVPMIAVAVANGSRLARVVVHRAQSKQMVQMLIAKLGGLIDRQIYHLPFARSPRLDATSAVTVKSMLQECMRNGGILLAQPEHILSLRHMGPEQFIHENIDLGRKLLDIQTFFDDNARDIIDECDENFNVRLELIYTMGEQQPIEGNPWRWALIQEVLDLMRRKATAIAEKLPSELEVTPGRPGGFARMRILKANAGKLLIEALGNHITSHGLRELQISNQKLQIRNAVRMYILKPDITKEEAEILESSDFWTSTTSPHLLLLRGLLAGGILQFVFSQKRWRVDYGLAERDPPTRLAVPYRAKDCPALRSEFSHPDVVITLTSLCYYYGGLSDDDLFVALGHLMESDQADVEYQAWVADAPDLPQAFKQLQGVNLQDRPQCIDHLFPALSYAKRTIDYFLSHIVFPKEMREFPHKLSASGWDIGKTKAQLTTGFSGTNDSRPTFPLDMHYLDLPTQRHTSALVLEFLLQAENSVSCIPEPAAGSHDAETLLHFILHLDPPVQVILDVGAQILELDNLTFAQRWLAQHDQSKRAVVFVDHEDNICVLDRHARIESLHTSSFATSLSSCLVFLDQSHTRGIDLKLPKTSRAAVLLGPRLAKDSLVQACMRMRKLGRGQSVVFCAPADVRTKIVETSSLAFSSVEIADVIRWSIAETFAANRRNLLLWQAQGERFVRQKKIWAGGLKPEKAPLLLEKEKQELEERYRPHLQREKPDTEKEEEEEEDLRWIRQRCSDLGSPEERSGTLQEEQERELAPESEQEREMQHAPPMKPATHSLHPDVRLFAQSGVVKAGSVAYMPAFQSLRRSSVDPDFDADQLCSANNVLVSADFAKTVTPTGLESFVSDFFLRPVQWLLTIPAKGTHEITYLMIISPFEANELLPQVMAHCPATLHVYAPRCNRGFATMDALDFCNIPPRATSPQISHQLVSLLNVFAGQLYFSSFEQYKAYGQIFGVSTEIVTEDMERQGYALDAEGFIKCDDRGRKGGSSGLMQSPIRFLRDLITIRNGGKSIARTQVGDFLIGVPLSQREFGQE